MYRRTLRFEISQNYWNKKHQGGELTVGSFRLGHIQLAQAEIAESDVTPEIDQDIFGFEVTVTRSVS